MPGMAVTPSRTQPNAEHDAEAAKQLEIASEVDAPAKTVASPAPDETVVETASKVTLRSKNVEQYPLTVSVVGAGEDGLVFDGPDTTLDVDSQVAEQVTYMPNVEVVA